MDIYEAAFERAPDPILVVDGKGSIVRANGQAERTFGYDAGGLKGLAIESLIPERFGTVHARDRERYMHDPKVRPMGSGLDLRGRRRDGSEFPIDVMLSVAETPRGQVAIAILRDITETRKVRDQLQDALGRVRLSAESAGMGYWTYDEASGEFWCDDVCAGLFGGRPEELRNVENVRLRILPEDREVRRRRALDSLEARGRFESEFRVMHPDGAIRWLRDLGRLTYTAPDGKSRRYSGVTYDISARKRAEILAEDAHRRERELLDLAPEGIFVADLEGRYVEVNDSGCRLLGMPREEILGKTIMDLIAPEEAPRLAATKANLLGGAIDVSEWSLRRRDGSPLPVEVCAKIFPDGRWQGFVRDITERKEAEAKQAALVKSLQESLREIKVLRGMLPICSHCKRIRDDAGQWQPMESYISKRTEADFSHGICPDCAREFYADFLPSGKTTDAPQPG